METEIIQLVSSASANLYKNNTLSCFVNQLPTQQNFEGEWEVALSEISHPVLYQNIVEGKFRYKANNHDTEVDPMYLQPGLYHSMIDGLSSMTKLITETRKTNETPLLFDIDHRTQKVKITLPYDDSILVIQSEDLSHILVMDQVLYWVEKVRKKVFTLLIFYEYIP